MFSVQMESNSQYNTHKQKPSELSLFPTNNAGDDVKVSVQKTLNGLTETLREAPILMPSLQSPFSRNKTR